MVFVAFVTACLFAEAPTTSPSSEKEMIEGVVLAPSKFSIIFVSPLSNTETQELVVPKSIPTKIFNEDFEKNLIAKWMEQEKQAEETVAAMQRAVKNQQENFEQRKNDRLDMLRQQHLEAMERLQVTYRNRLERETNLENEEELAEPGK